MNRPKPTWRILLTLCLSSAFIFALPAQAASFDCAKAKSKIEHLICDNAEISKRDEDLDTVYKAALQDQTQARKIRQTQKKWLKERDTCKDAACVK